jgi:hypothetical protein
MAGGVYCHFTIGSAGAASANARYITREGGTGGHADALHFHNYPEYAKAGRSYTEQRRNIIEYNRQREEDELTRPRRGGGQTRTHYRCKLSFEGKITTERAREMAKEYLERNFPTAQALAAVHQDTAHTHVHINIQARGTDDKKLNLSEQKFRNLDSAWARLYGREFGQEKMREHEQKKQQMREWKREYAQAKARGEEVSKPAPERADRPLSTPEHREREARNYGYDQTRTGRDQRGVTNRDQPATRGERAIDDHARQRDRTEQAARGALQQTERVRDGAHEQERDVGRSR